MDWVFFLFMLFLGSMMDNLELKLHILLFCLFITEEKTWHSSSPLHPTMSFRTHFKLRTEGFNQSAEHTHASAPVAMNENIWLCYYAYWNRKKNLRWMSQRSELDVFLKYNSPGLHVKCLYLLKFDLVKVDHKTYGRVSNFIAI